MHSAHTTHHPKLTDHHERAARRVIIGVYHMAPCTGPGDPASGQKGPTSPGQSETLAGRSRAGATRSRKLPLPMGAPRCGVVCWVRRKAAAAKAERGARKARIIALEWEWVQIHASRPFSQAVDREDSDECCLRLVIWSRFEVFLARNTSTALCCICVRFWARVGRPRRAAWRAT